MGLRHLGVFCRGGPLESDGLSIFTSLRPESWAVPVEAIGGAAGWGIDAGAAATGGQADGRRSWQVGALMPVPGRVQPRT